MGVAVVLLANVFFCGWEMSEFGGGKCPNLGVVNVRLANNLTPYRDTKLFCDIFLLELAWYQIY